MQDFERYKTHFKSKKRIRKKNYLYNDYRRGLHGNCMSRSRNSTQYLIGNSFNDLFTFLNSFFLSILESEEEDEEL